jgi:predicted ATPase
MFLRKLVLKNILSFKDTSVELGPLNVLIGANAVGKSNLIEVISLLQAAPTSLSKELLRGGGVRQWLWLGERGLPVGQLECGIVLNGDEHAEELGYRLEFSEDSGGPVILGEALRGLNSDDAASVYFTRTYNQTEFGPRTLGSTPPNSRTVAAVRTDSVLSQVRNPLDPTPITKLSNYLEHIRIFREFRTGPRSPIRYGISTSVPKDFLSDDGDNLALVLNELDFHGVHERIKDYLIRFCERFEDVKIRVGAGLAQTFLRESGLVESLAGMRISDGTLKFLCILAAVFNPSPPPLICIEVPELGMHPDALRLIAEVLVEASQSVQLIVTTHSEALVDALSDHPEHVVVCERDLENSTQFRRLSSAELDEWLEHYTLGQLWRKGEIGGVRY